MSLLFALGMLLAVAGCSGAPADFGITGPGVPVPAAPGQGDNVIDRPGLTDPGAGYGPSVAPSTGTGRYFNYN